MRIPVSQVVSHIDRRKIIQNYVELNSKSDPNPVILYDGDDLFYETNLPLIKIHSIKQMLNIINQIKPTSIITCFGDSSQNWGVFSYAMTDKIKGFLTNEKMFLPLKNKRQCLKIRALRISSFEIPLAFCTGITRLLVKTSQLTIQKKSLQGEITIETICNLIADYLPSHDKVAVSCRNFSLYKDLKVKLASKYKINIQGSEQNLIQGVHPLQDCLEFAYSQSIPWVNLCQPETIEIINVC